jgi:hypothetical protein
LSLVRCFVTRFPLCRATSAWQVIFLLSAANSFCGPQFPCVRDFLKTFLLRHATLARRNTFLQATANFLRDPQFPQVTSFGSLCHRAARCQPLCRFFHPLTVSLQHFLMNLPMFYFRFHVF